MKRSRKINTEKKKIYISVEPKMMSEGRKKRKPLGEEEKMQSQKK